MPRFDRGSVCPPEASKANPQSGFPLSFRPTNISGTPDAAGSASRSTHGIYYCAALIGALSLLIGRDKRAHLHEQLTSIASARPGPMLAFTDSQLRAVWAAVDRVPFEKRGVEFVRWLKHLSNGPTLPGTRSRACTVISPGCANCYAMRMAARLEGMSVAKYAGLTRKSGGRSVWTGKITLDDKSLEVPGS